MNNKQAEFDQRIEMFQLNTDKLADDYANQLIAFRDSFSELQEYSNALATENNHLKDQLNISQFQSNEDHQALASILSDHNILLSKYSESENKLQDKMNEIDRLTIKVNHYAETYKSDVLMKQELGNELVQLNESIQDLNKQLNMKMENITDLKQQVVVLEQEAKEHLTINAELQQSYDALYVELSSKKQLLSEQLVVHTELKGHVTLMEERTQQDKQTYATSITKLEQELINERDINKDLVSNVKTLEIEISNYKENLINLSNKYEESCECVIQLQKDTKDLQEIIQEKEEELLLLFSEKEEIQLSLEHKCTELSNMEVKYEEDNLAWKANQVELEAKVVAITSTANENELAFSKESHSITTAHDMFVQELQSEHINEMKTAKLETELLLQNLRDTHAMELKAQETDYSLRIEQIKSEQFLALHEAHNSIIKMMQEKHIEFDADIKIRQEKFKEELLKQSEEYSEQALSRKLEYETTINNIKANFEIEVQNARNCFSAQIVVMQLDHANTIEKLNGQHIDIVHKMELDHIHIVQTKEVECVSILEERQKAFDNKFTIFATIKILSHHLHLFF